MKAVTNALMARLFAALFVGLLLILASDPAGALGETMEFTFTGNGSGTLSGISFPTSDFVITSFVDTANRQRASEAWFIDHTSASVSIASLGDFSILTGTRTFVNFRSKQVGFSRAGLGGYDLYSNLNNPAFGTWDMLTPIGPFSGNMNLKQWTGYSPLIDTTGGILIFNTGSCIGTFRAVPEPATLSLLALGFGAVLMRRRKVQVK